MSLDTSPYQSLSHDQWRSKTQELIAKHPLAGEHLIDLVLTSWKDVFDSKLGLRGYRIGLDIKPKPQIMGFFLHEFLQLEIAHRYPGVWRGEISASDKDLVYIPDPKYSIEIKTSSHPAKIFGNRSYAQESKSSKKSKSGFYIAINFEKFLPQSASCDITKIRFGWLDTEDWRGQSSQSGQQASLSPQVEAGKLVTLYSKAVPSPKEKKPTRTRRR
jgi:hypothetical protein